MTHSLNHTYALAEEVVREVLPKKLFKALQQDEEIYDKTVFRTRQLIEHYANITPLETKRREKTIDKLASALSAYNNNALTIAGRIRKRCLETVRELKNNSKEPIESVSQEEKPPFINTIISPPSSPSPVEPKKEKSPQKAKPEEPQGSLADVDRADYYQALLDLGGEVAQQAWLFAMRYKGATYTTGQFGHQNWMFRVSLQSVGVPAEQASAVMGAIRYYTQKYPEIIGKQPKQAPYIKKDVQLPSHPSLQTYYLLLKNQSPMVTIATDYIVSQHLDEDGQFVVPEKRAIDRDLKRFRQTLIKETDWCDNKDLARQVQDKLIDYIRYNAPKLSQEKQTAIGR